MSENNLDKMQFAQFVQHTTCTNINTKKNLSFALVSV